MPYFTKENFIADLYHNVFGENEAVNITKLSCHLKDKVFTSSRIELEERDFTEAFSCYRKLLREINYYNTKTRKYSVYSISAIAQATIRSTLYTFTGECDHSLETVVSLCVACKMPFSYIDDAVEAFCGEVFSGRSLRKILLRGAAKGFFPFEELAYKSLYGKASFGIYEKVYSEAFNTYNGIPKHEGKNTLYVTGQIDDCTETVKFFEKLATKDIQHSILYDSIDISKTVEKMVLNRRKTEQSLNNLFDEYEATHLRTNYVRIVNENRIPGYRWFVDFCKAFRLTKDEIERLRYVLHYNTLLQNEANAEFNKLLNIV